MRERIEPKPPTTMSQRSFASAEYAMKKKRARRKKFLAEMERIESKASVRSSCADARRPPPRLM